MMRKLRGLKLRKRLILFSKWVGRKIRPSLSPARSYHRLGLPRPKPNFLNWSRIFPFGKQIPTGSSREPDPVPKGQLAVYVGKSEAEAEGGELNRVVVPVVYLKHRPFMELLREAEEEYGFGHERGITLPCGFSEFQTIRTRIRDCRRSSRRRRPSGTCC